MLGAGAIWCIVGFFKTLLNLGQFVIQQILISVWMPKAKSARPKAAAAKRKASRAKTPYYKPAESLRKKTDAKDTIGMDLDNGKYVPGVNVSVVFKNLCESVVLLIDTQVPGDFIMAAVAWLTSKPILEALTRARERGVIVLVVLQKEKWLRKGKSQTEFHKKLRARYDALGSLSTGSIVEPLLKAFSPTPREWKFPKETLYLQATRCAGDWVTNEFNARRMHHKFLVCGSQSGDERGYVAKTVWTGSYNFSASAEASLENAVMIHDSPYIARSFAKEFAMIYMNSEPLDWISERMLSDLRFDVTL